MTALSENLDLEFVRFLTENLLDYPEAIELHKTEDDAGILLSLKVDKDDMGKIIGKNGHTIKSIRTLLRVIGAKSNQRITLKIEEPDHATG